jgi:hypothetical protein
VQQKLGDAYLTVSDLREKLQNGDDSIVKKIVFWCISKGNNPILGTKSKRASCSYTISNQ